MMKQMLLDKIRSKEIVVGVVGLGYVGLPLAVEKAKAGYKTIGFDVQKEKVDMVNAGHNYIGDVVNEDLEAIVKSGMLSATTDFTFVKDVDFIAICVPTPLDEHQQPDISYVHDSAVSVSKHLKKAQWLFWNLQLIPVLPKNLLNRFWKKAPGLNAARIFISVSLRNV